MTTYYLKNKSKLLRKRPAHRLKIFLKYLLKKEDKEPVFILSTRRSGSNLLLGYLNSIPGVSLAAEILNENMFYGIRSRKIAKAAVLRHIAYSINNCAQRICGAKLLRFQLDAHGIGAEDLKKRFPSAKFIILYRKSLLEQFVSLKMAEKTNVWVCEKKELAPPFLPVVHVDVREFQKYRDSVKLFYGNLLEKNWLKECSLVVSYEDMAEDAQGLFRERIFPFLGLSYSAVSSRTIKQNTGRLCDVVENFSELDSLDVVFCDNL